MKASPPDTRRLNGVVSTRWLGWFFFFTALGTLAMAVASVGNSLRMERLRAEVEELRAAVAAMQNMQPRSQQPPQPK